MSKTAKILLNKKTITGPVDKNNDTCAFYVKKNNKLEIEGYGTIDGNSNSKSNNAIVIDGGHVIINGGVFTTGKNYKGNANACILIKGEGSKLEINNGEFHANANNELWVPIIDIKNYIKRNRYTVIIKGGVFYGYDPSKGDDKMLKNFVAEGYQSIPTGYYLDEKGNKLVIYKVEKTKYEKE
jgi:hypothetical protein